MTISPVQLARSPKQIELKTLNLDNDKRFVLWWYGAICRPMHRNHVPRVVLWFRQLHEDCTLGNFFSSNAALTSLGQLRIGSVWEGKRSRVQLQYTRREFNVNFREEHWTHARSCAQHRNETGAELIPQGTYTVPLKPSIHILRTEFPDVGDEDYSGKPHPQRQTREFGEDEVVPIGDDLTPDHGTEMLVIADPSIRMLESAPVTKLTTDKSVSRGSPGPTAQAAEVGAPGEAGGSGKGVGLARFVSDIELEPKGALRDLWNGLQHLQAQHPEILTVLGGFSFKGTTSSSVTQELKLLSLEFSEEVEDGRSLSAPARKWVYMHSDEPTKPRGVLVVEVGSPMVRGYLFEVQRRIMSPDSDKGAKEESYCGLAIKAPAGKSPEDWIPEVLFQIAKAEGIMKKALAHLPSLNGQDYRRSFSTSDEVAGQSTATNALGKLNITFPKRTSEGAHPRGEKKSNR